MGAVDSKIGFNFGEFKFDAIKRRKRIPRHNSSRKKSYSGIPSSTRLRTRKLSFDSRSKSISRSRSYKKYPDGTWINTAKDYYIKHNILYAKLKNKNGIYINASIHYNKDDILKNYDGKFVLLDKKEYYTTDNFNVYYKSKKIDISPLGFKILGDGYAKNNFDIIYKGVKMNVLNIHTFKVLENGNAKDIKGYFYKGKRI